MDEDDFQYTIESDVEEEVVETKGKNSSKKESKKRKAVRVVVENGTSPLQNLILPALMTCTR